MRLDRVVLLVLITFAPQVALAHGGPVFFAIAFGPLLLLGILAPIGVKFSLNYKNTWLPFWIHTVVAFLISSLITQAVFSIIWGSVEKALASSSATLVIAGTIIGYLFLSILAGFELSSLFPLKES